MIVKETALGLNAVDTASGTTFYHQRLSEVSLYSSHSGIERRENGDGPGLEVKEAKGLGKASSTWSRLIHRIFEVNPLKCRKYGGIMRLIAFIIQRSETMRILKHIGEQTKRNPPLKTKLAPENPRQTLFWEYLPSVEAYIGNPQYVN